VVFHRRRSSHLFYTSYVFSQCQTRVKLNQLVASTTTGLRGKARPRIVLWALGAGRALSRGISTYLKPCRGRTDTFACVTTALASSPRDCR